MDLDEGDERDAGRSFVVEWFRPRILGRLLRGSAIPAVLIAAGASVLAVMGSSPPAAYSEVFTILGLLLTIVGPALGIRHFFRILREDRCLIFTSQGLTYDRDGAHHHVRWETIDDATYDEALDRVFVTREDGEHARGDA